jgi:hypothetical protein
VKNDNSEEESGAVHVPRGLHAIKPMYQWKRDRWMNVSSLPPPLAFIVAEFAFAP